MFIDKFAYKVISYFLLFLTFCLWLLFWVDLGYPSISFSVKGVERYFSLFETFNKIFAFIFSALGFFLIVYRVGQSERQIEIMQSQNLFANYYKHREEFVKFVERSVCSYFDADYSYDLYKKLFTKSYFGDYHIQEGVLKDIANDSFKIDRFIIESLDIYEFEKIDIPELYRNLKDFNRNYGASSIALKGKYDYDKFKDEFEMLNEAEFPDSSKRTLTICLARNLHHYFLTKKLLKNIIEHFCGDEIFLDNNFVMCADDKFDFNVVVGKIVNVPYIINPVCEIIYMYREQLGVSMDDLFSKS